MEVRVNFTSKQKYHILQDQNMQRSTEHTTSNIDQEKANEKYANQTYILLTVY